jgi:GDPmannose 4,6-dehydratase
MRSAIIFGVTGQDGSYLSELLLEKGYAVIGVARRSSVDTKERLGIAMRYHDFYMEEGDVTDEVSVNKIIKKYDDVLEIYNLAAQSHVHTSFDQPQYTLSANYHGVLNIMEAIRRWNIGAKFYQASTSEMFGNNFSIMVAPDGVKAPTILYQDEDTGFQPTSPYAIAKTAAHNLVKMYREAHALFACSGILFNHESERRGNEFVTRKITRYVGWLANQGQHFEHFRMKTDRKLHLGNLEAKRDWGHALDYVNAMWLMLQQDRPKDYVIATGETHSVAEFCEAAFKCVGIDDWKRFVHINEKFYRPSDVEYLCGDPSLAKEELGWKLTIPFEQLVQRMVVSDIDTMKGQPCPTLS